MACVWELGHRGGTIMRANSQEKKKELYQSLIEGWEN